jgi:hypothetical protein
MTKSKWYEQPITIRLTAYQRKVLWGVVVGAEDAGACEGGLTPGERSALNIISEKLLGIRGSRCPAEDNEDPEPGAAA